MNPLFPDLTKAANNLKRLAIHEGFQRVHLADKIEDDLRAIWGITESDSLSAARGKAIAHLERAIDQRVEPPYRRRAREFFNISDDRAMWQLLYGARLRAIHARDGKGHSPREIERDANAQFLDPLRADLAVLLQDWHEAQPAELVADLHDFATELHQPERLPQKRIATFLRLTYVVPRLGPSFALAHTVSRGTWLPVFLNRQSHDSYSAALNITPSWQPVRLTGAALLTELHEQRLETGICVQPEAGTTTPIGQPLAYEWSDVNKMITAIL